MPAAAASKIMKTRTETSIQASELRAALESTYTLTPEGKFLDKDGAAIVFAEVEGMGLSLSYGSEKGTYDTETR